jgi:N-acetylglucosaminyldiphosphoundecaprenol N-acetyl-beta-D-mannosaminyltransferase
MVTPAQENLQSGKYRAPFDPVRNRVDVLGVGISPLTMDSTLRIINSWIEERSTNYICVTGVHGVMESQRDDQLRRIHNESGLTTPDGVPMVWACHWAGCKDTERVYGPDLVLEVCAQAVEKGWKMFFCGGKPGTADRLSRRLTTQFPGLVVTGTYSPPFAPMDTAAVDDMLATINDAKPDIVWVGLSTPKQERWMAAHRARLEAPVLIGVGAAFDIHAGDLKQAPLWIQSRGLEWIYRLVREPRRLWHRYLSNNPRFVLAVVRRPPRLRL